jgi:nucleotide-binding universal stress UspA family protein
MSGVICAIRGGPSSKPTIQHAIHEAKSKDLHLYFLYVVNLDFLVRTQISRTSLISKQMHKMGEFILLDAQAKALAKDVTSEGVIRHGKVREQIIELAEEIEADTIILGLPGDETDENVFTEEEFQAFCDRLARESGAQVIIAKGEVE